MWNRRANIEERREMGGRQRLVAVAVDKDKFSQHALKWASERILTRHQTVKLIHVIHASPLNHYNVNPNPIPAEGNNNGEFAQHHAGINSMEVFLPFRCFCTRRRVPCELVVLQRQDVARALIEYVSQYGVEVLLLGAPSKTGLTRLFKAVDIPSTVMKWAPDFCSVYIVSKGKCHAVRSATRPVPSTPVAEPKMQTGNISNHESPTTTYDEYSAPEMDISFSSCNSGRQSTDSTFFSFYENLGVTMPRGASSRLSNIEGRNFDQSPCSSGSSRPPVNRSSLPELPSNSLDSGRTSCSSQNMDDLADEIRRLKMELKQTTEIYHAACKEAVAAKQKAMELEQWKMKEEKRSQDAQMTEEREKAKLKAAIGAAEVAERILKLEVQKRVSSDLRALKEAEEKTKVLGALGQCHMVLKNQSFFHILVVLFLFYFYFSVLKRNF